MKKRIREFLSKYIYDTGENSEFFYGKYQGGNPLSFLKKILVIFLDLSTTKDYFYYHNHPLILSTFGKATKNKQLKLNSFEEATFNALQDEGIVFLEGYFKDQVSSLARDNIDEIKDPRNKQYFIYELAQNEAFFEILNNKSLINIASAYYGVQSYYRYRPSINFVNPAREDIRSGQRGNQEDEESFEGDEWHVDSIYNLQYHILLNDVLPGQSRMLFAKGDPVGIFDRFSKFASEEYVQKHFSILDCYGPKGTVYLFDGSKHWHRFYPVKASTRASCSVLFSRGQQVAKPGDYETSLNQAKINKGMEAHCKFVV